MKISSLIFLMHWSVVWSVCDYGRDWRVKAALYMNSQLILLTTDDVVYHVKDFKYESGRMTFDSIDETNLFSEWIRKIYYLFRYEDYVISFNLEYVSGISRLVGYKMYLNNEVTKVSNYSEFKINMYTYVPKEDKLNLMSLLAKFPEDDIQKKIKSIVSFPFDRPELPNRFFVYYSENSLSNGGAEDNFKRHILIKSISDFGGINEINWKHDESSGKCVPENVETDTVIRLSDKYIASVDKFRFDIMEFTGTQYSIKGVEVDNKGVQRNMILHKTGSITSVLGCVIRSTPPSGRKKPFKITWIHVMMAILIVFFTMAIMFLSFFIVMVLIRIIKLRRREGRGLKKKIARSSGKSSPPSGKRASTTSDNPSKAPSVVKAKPSTKTIP